jgi:hypothetical protein
MSESPVYIDTEEPPPVALKVAVDVVVGSHISSPVVSVAQSV